MAFAAALRRVAGMSSLKVAWKRDPILDSAIEKDKKWRLFSRVIREVLNEPNSSIPLRYLEKRRQRLRLPVTVKTLLRQNPLFFEIYPDRIKPDKEPVPFVRPSSRLTKFLQEEKRIRSSCENLAVEKLSKLLMISDNKILSAEKLLHVKRDFGFPNDFLTSLIPKFPERFRISGDFVELVYWDEEFAKSAVEKRAIEEGELTGIGIRPNFEIRLPKGFHLKKEMREWMRDWIELPYISPYADAAHLEAGSPEMEKRMVAVLHEFLSLTVLRRAAVPSIGKFAEELRLSNAFANAFTRHCGLFYLSLKGGIETAMLREAYGDGGEIVDRDPMLEIKDLLVEVIEEGHGIWLEEQRARREAGAERELRDSRETIGD